MGQRKMPLMGEAYVANLKNVPQREVEQCESVLDSLILCRQHSHYRKDYMIADLLDMHPTKLSRSLNGTSHFPVNRLEEYEEVCGVQAFTQYWAMRRRLIIPETDEDRELRELREQEEDIRRRREELEARQTAA